MGQAAQTTATAVDTSTRFLVELETLWTLLRLYGTAHPAFARGAASAAAPLAQPLRFSISPRGFAVGKTALLDPALQTLSQRLRAMGLVGLAVEPGLTAAQLTALILTLDEADRSHATGAAVVEKISATTGGRITAVPLRLAGLRLTEGVSQDAAPPDGETTVWRDLFAAACSGRHGGQDAGELAESFELALKSVSSPAQWEAMVQVWVRQLSAAAPPGAEGPRLAAAPDTAPGTPVRDAGDTLDAAAAFLAALSPQLSRRLLAETFNGQAAPNDVVVALADRLPQGVVLGALASVDRSSGEPSAAALALLRKISSNLPGPTNPAANSPRTTAEMVEVAASLERLLGSNNESSFVPESYLARRQQLSGGALNAAEGGNIRYPDQRETARHAADLAFQILSTPDTGVTDLASALAYVRTRTGDWIKSGAFGLAAEGMTRARTLSGHWDPAVSKPALELVAYAVDVADLVEGARQSKDRAAAAAGVADLLGRLDGAALARALQALKPSPGGGHEAVLDAFARVLPSLAGENFAALCKAFKDATPPPALLSVLSGLGADDAVKTVLALAPHAAVATRRAVVHAVFRNDFRWPLPLTESLLRDDEADIRRLAVMKLVGDADLATVARFFRDAMDRSGPFEPDVALGLAELLGRHRNHPEVRAAFRQWTWSGRRWAALFSVSLAGRGRAA